MLRTRNMIKFFGAVIIILAAFVTLIYPLANSIKQGLDYRAVRISSWKLKIRRTHRSRKTL